MDDLLIALPFCALANPTAHAPAPPPFRPSPIRLIPPSGRYCRGSMAAYVASKNPSVDFPRYCRSALHFCTLLSRASMRSLRVGKKEVKKNVPWVSRREQSQKKWIVRKEKNQNLTGGTQEKSKEWGTAPKKSVHGFFWGLQNHFAILHVTKSPSMALYCLAGKKSISSFFTQM